MGDTEPKEMNKIKEVLMKLVFVGLGMAIAVSYMFAAQEYIKQLNF